MTIRGLIEENINVLLDSDFMGDGECQRIKQSIMQMENGNDSVYGELMRDGSAFCEYVELLRQQNARMVRLAYLRGMEDTIDFMHGKGK